MPLPFFLPMPLWSPMNEGLSTDFMINAHIRIAAKEGVPITVRRRGDKNVGTIILKINRLDGTARVLTQVRIDDELVWSPVGRSDSLSEEEADRYLDQQARVDPDSWLLEIEDKEGRIWFTGKVLES
jgi:hypothetical protein